MRPPILPLIATSFVLAAALTLGGCGKKSAVKNGSLSDAVGQFSAPGLRFNPGHWESTVKFVKLEMEGIPPETKAMMARVLGKDRTFDSCLTSAQAAKPEAKFFGQADDRCKYDSFNMADGKIDSKMTCTSEKGVQAMIMTGTYTPDTYQMQMSINGKSAAGKGMSMTMALSAKHEGECTGTEES